MALLKKAFVVEYTIPRPNAIYIRSWHALIVNYLASSCDASLHGLAALLVGRRDTITIPRRTSTIFSTNLCFGAIVELCYTI